MVTSLLAADVLQRLGKLLGLPRFLEVTVEDDNSLDLSEFDVRLDAGVLLDGVGDALALKRRRKPLRGRLKICRGGKPTTMIYSYP